MKSFVQRDRVQYNNNNMKELNAFRQYLTENQNEVESKGLSRKAPYLFQTATNTLHWAWCIKNNIGICIVPNWDIADMWWDGDNVMGKIEILPTPSGNILKELIKSGVTVGVSSRGMGSLEERGGMMEVQDDFELLCWDFVSTPSNPGSYMTTLSEGKNTFTYDYTKVNSIIHEILCSKGSCSIV